MKRCACRWSFTVSRHHSFGGVLLNLGLSLYSDTAWLGGYTLSQARGSGPPGRTRSPPAAAPSSLVPSHRSRQIVLFIYRYCVCSRNPLLGSIGAVRTLVVRPKLRSRGATTVIKNCAQSKY